MSGASTWCHRGICDKPFLPLLLTPPMLFFMTKTLVLLMLCIVYLTHGTPSFNNNIIKFYVELLIPGKKVHFHHFLHGNHQVATKKKIQNFCKDQDKQLQVTNEFRLSVQIRVVRLFTQQLCLSSPKAGIHTHMYR